MNSLISLIYVLFRVLKFSNFLSSSCVYSAYNLNLNSEKVICLGCIDKYIMIDNACYLLDIKHCKKYSMENKTD